LEEECYLIADHLRTNWQDYEQPKIWERIGKKIDKIISTLPDFLKE
jgi:tRNA-dihydrouridine synthase